MTTEAMRLALDTLTDLMGCPYDIDAATVPHAGISAAPDQVVGTMSVALVRIRKALTAITALRAPATPTPAVVQANTTAAGAVPAAAF